MIETCSPHPLPTPPPERHLRESRLDVLLDAALFPFPALLINRRLSAHKVGYCGVNERRPLEHLPKDKHKDAEPCSEVACNEALHAERHKRVVSNENDHHDSEDESQVRRVGRERGRIREHTDVEFLRNARTVPANVRPQHADIGAHERASRQADEPVEHFDRVVRTDQEGEAGEQRHCNDGVNRYTGLCALEEELGRLAVARETVQRPAGCIQVCVSARPARQQDEEVDEARQALDSQVRDADDPGRSSGAGLAGVNSTQQSVVARRADDADSQHAEDVEPDEAVEDEFCHARDCAPRVLDFSRRQTDHVWAGDGEGRVDRHAPEAAEAARSAVGVIRVNCISACPVTESVAVVLRVAAKHGDKGEQDKTDEEKDLCARHDKLRLAVPLDRNDIEEHAHDHCHGDPDSGIHVRVPVLHDRRDGAVFGAHQHHAREEVRPAHCKAECGIDEARGELEDGAPERQVSAHFCDAQVRGPHKESAPEYVAEHKGEGTGFGERGADAYEETCADGSWGSLVSVIRFGEVDVGGPPMAISWTWRGESPRRVCPYFASSAAVKCELSSTIPFFGSLSYCEVTSAVLEALVVGAISGSTPMLEVVYRRSFRSTGRVGEVDLRLGKIREDPHGLYTIFPASMVAPRLSACCISMAHDVALKCAK